MPADQREGRRLLVRGVVQGVGFRPWVWRLAQQAGLAGRVFNDGQGVTIEVFGAPAALDRFVAELDQPPPAARIHSLQSETIPSQDASAFIIAASGPAGEPGRRVSIPPDIATCADCLAEIEDPRARRFHYALTNCTQCGPRFSIAREIPYDRAHTTMASFAMCADCRREYEDPTDRRFHAQPIACPACGPLLLLADSDGAALDLADPAGPAARLLAEGKILAVKGIGGYHLACDATSSPAVCRLRERKQRDQKPFAVMVRDLRAAEALAVLDDAERAMLASAERPIVLLRRKADSGLAPEVAPENPMVGLLLAYSPLHHLLLSQVERPLVMTSGNLSEEPIAFDDADAQGRLAGIADAWLVHDRPIENACDDSVGRLIAGQPVLFRRSRGYVPRPIVMSAAVAPVLACGAHLKNTFCLAQGRDAYLGPHIGDLDNLEPWLPTSARWRACSDSSASSPKSSPTICTLGTSRPATRWRVRRRARSPCNITTPMWPPPWPSTALPGQSSAWPMTAPDWAPMGRRGAARSCWPSSRISSAWPRCAPSPWRAAISPSGKCGGWRWLCSTTRLTATRLLLPWPCSTRFPPARSRSAVA